MGNEEWKDLAKLSLVAVERGRVDRMAVDRTGRKKRLVVDIDIV